MEQTICFVGVGPGNEKYLSEEARLAILEADLLTGSKRMLETAGQLLMDSGKKILFESSNREEIADFLNSHSECKKPVLLYSGDLSVFSGAMEMRKLLIKKGFDSEKMRFIPGISSASLFLSKIGIPLSETVLLSLHGREATPLPLLREKKYILLFLGNAGQASEIAEKLIFYGLSKVEMTLASRLSYPDESIVQGKPEDFLHLQHDSLSLLFLNNKDAVPLGFFGLPNELFFKGNVPMSKRESRIAILSRMKIKPDSVIFDIGAGTGSVSVEAALHAPYGKVYAFEKKEDAVCLIRENRRRFACDNLHVIPGNAPDSFRLLPEGLIPDTVFIGGSGGHLPEILHAVLLKNNAATVVISAVTLETLGCLLEEKKRLSSEYCINFSSLSAVNVPVRGPYHMMQAENPVWIAEIIRQ